jgi:hypothetical protein
MPCDSAAAGLITLGAMIRDLGDLTANDLERHYDKLLRYAAQYLESCRQCNLKVCNPIVKGCGHAKKVTGLLRSPLHPRKTFRISPNTVVAERKLVWSYPNGMTQSPTPAFAANWHIDGEAPLQWNDPMGALSGGPYREMFGDAQILSENLRSSYAGFCLAGRASGERRSREICDDIRFLLGGRPLSLSELLTVRNWSEKKLSRVAFFNSRTEQFDRHLTAPSLVVADGNSSFLRVAGRPEFAQSDVVAVIDRTLDRERLEEIGFKMAGLSQWYTEDRELVRSLPTIIPGVSLLIVRKK